MLVKKTAPPGVVKKNWTEHFCSIRLGNRGFWRASLTQKYGRYIGQSLGDGWAEVNLFVKEIDYLMSNDSIRIKLAKNAREYVETTHSFKNSKKILDNILDNIT